MISLAGVSLFGWRLGGYEFHVAIYADERSSGTVDGNRRGGALQVDEDMPLLNGTVTVILTVRHLVTSAAWYRALLAAVEVGRYAEPDGYLAQVVLREPITGLSLCLVQHRDGLEQRFDERRVGLDHIEFTVPSRESLDEWATRLDHLGIPHSGVKAPSYTSNAMITFRDPDNIQLEFFFSG